MNKNKKYSIWWYADKIITQITADEAEKLLYTAEYGWETVKTFKDVQYVSNEWVIIEWAD